jgi:hypothetical protein
MYRRWILSMNGRCRRIVTGMSSCHYRKMLYFRRPPLFPTFPRVPSEIALFPTAHGQPSEIGLFPMAHQPPVGNRGRPPNGRYPARPPGRTHTKRTHTHTLHPARTARRRRGPSSRPRPALPAAARGLPEPSPPGAVAPGQRRPVDAAASPPVAAGTSPPWASAAHARGRLRPAQAAPCPPAPPEARATSPHARRTRPPRSPPLAGVAEPQATSSQAFGARGRCRSRPETAAAVHSLCGRCPEAAAARRRVTRGRSRPRACRTLSARPPEAVVESSHVSARTRPFARGRTRPHVSARTQLHTGRQPSLLWAIQVISNFINVML